MDKKYYVYLLIDPRNEQPFYAGKGSGQRYNDHLTEQCVEKSGNRHKFYKIQAIRKANLEPTVIFVQQNLPEKEAYNLERETILKYGRKNIDENGILTNICLDNRPPDCTGRTVSLETRDKIRNSQPTLNGTRPDYLKNQWSIKRKQMAKDGHRPWNYNKPGYHLSPEGKESLRQATILAWKEGRNTGHTGHTNSDESNDKRRQWNKENDWSPPIKAKKGHKWSDEAIKKRSATVRKRNVERKASIIWMLMLILIYHPSQLGHS